MGLSGDFRATVGTVWERVVTHSFVIELGDGTLPQAAFGVYFDQDYLFLKDRAIPLSLATSKSPDFDAARQLVGFLHAGLAGKEGGSSSKPPESAAFLHRTWHHCSTGPPHLATVVTFRRTPMKAAS